MTPTAASSWPTQRPTASVSSEVVGAAEGRGTEHRARLAGVQPADVAALLVDRDHGARGWRARISALRAARAAGPSAVLLPK